MSNESLKKQARSFKHAFRGFNFVFTTQLNFKTHLGAALLVILAGIYFRLSQTEWLVIVLTIFLVLVVEVLNSAVELATDGLKEHKKTERDDFLIGVSKDVAAAAVLLSAINSVIVGAVIFLPKAFTF